MTSPSSTENKRNSAPECELCGSGNREVISSRDRDGNSLETVMCTHCGLVSHAVIPTEEELRAYYASEYRNDYHGERTPSDRRVMRAWKNGTRICNQVSPFLPLGASVLEVGAGIGCTVKAFDRAGFDAQGIDPNGEFLDFARTKLQASVKTASLHDLASPDHAQRHEAVLLVHVIEHLRSPRDAFQQLSRLLSPDGLLYVECPNLAAPFARRAKMFHRAHLYNFTPATLTTLATMCGFELGRTVWRRKRPKPAVAVAIHRPPGIPHRSRQLPPHLANALQSRILVLPSSWTIHPRTNPKGGRVRQGALAGAAICTRAC